MQLRPDRTMKRPSAKKAAAKLKPVVIHASTRDQLSEPLVHVLLQRLTAAELKDHLRARCLPIPKDKAEMIARLAIFLSREQGTCKLTLF